MTTIDAVILILLPTLMVIAYNEARYMKDKKAKKKRGRVIVIKDKPDTRSECPRCHVKADRPLLQTKTRQLNGKTHRWGTYKCGVDGCPQCFTRKLPKYDD